MDGWVNGLVNGWPDVKSIKSNKSCPNQDNSITDILDIFWTFYLNHHSPLWGFFLLFYIVSFIPAISINAVEGAGMSLGESVTVSPFSRSVTFLHLEHC